MSSHLPETDEISNSTPLYNSRIIKVYMEYLKQYHHEIDTNSILKYAEMSPLEVNDPCHWFSQRQVDRFQEILFSKTGNPNIAREAGRHLSLSQGMGPTKQFVFGLLGLPSLYMMMAKAYPIFSRAAIIKSKKLGSNKVELTTYLKPGVHEHPKQCENRIGSYESFGKFFTSEFSTVEHPECFHRGDQYCRYIVSWTKTPSLFWKKVRNFSTLMSVLISGVLFFVLTESSWISIILFFILFNMGISLYYIYLRNFELSKIIISQGDAAKDLLEEMNIRSNYASLVQKIGQATLNILDIEKALYAVMEVMKNHLGFDRGMIMLAKEDKSLLRFVVGYGHTEEALNILQKAEFRLDKPGSKGLFTRVYHEKQPYLVNDINEIKEKFSARSREFAEKIGSQSAICVPIVYKKEVLGILAVDNIKSKKTLTQSDLRILEGVASQAALCIVNAASFQKLQESEQKYRLLADNVADIIWTMDIVKLNFTYVSPSVKRILGYTPEETVNMTISKILTKPSLEIAMNVLKEELEKQKEERAERRMLELELLRKDGLKVYAEITASFVEDANGEIQGILGVARDLVERKKAEEEKKRLEERLSRSQKMEAIGLLAGGVAHDINNILTAIVGYPDLILMQIPIDSPIRKALLTIQESGQKAAAIVQDLLTLARRGVTHMEVLKLNDIISDYLRSPEHDKLIRLHPDTNVLTRLPDDLPNIEGSPVHLKKTLMNLIINAAEAQPNGGDVVISTEVRCVDIPVQGYQTILEGDYVVIKVQDQGTGISPDDLKKIFEPFYTKKTMGRSGTGLGMTVVWGTMQDHRGFINVESRLHQGTTFELYFPITKRVMEGKPSPMPIENYMGRGESILVVDDVKEQRDIASSILKQLGYSVSEAQSGEQAIEYFTNNSADLLLLDMIMEPGIDGLDTYRRIIELHPEQKAIVVSGYSDSERVIEAQKLGAGAYVKKPYRLENLGMAVRFELDKGRSISVRQ